jgi:hypothetical protein
MNIVLSIRTGFVRALRSWRVVLIDWILTFSIVILVALPLRTALNSWLGSSMITERLANGINFDVIADLGTNFTALISMFSIGFFLVIFIGLLINVFITGGLFNCMKGTNGKFSSSIFFSGAISNFWSYFVIMLIISIIILVVGFLVIVIPILIAGGSGSIEGSKLRAFIRFGSIFLLILPLFLLIADYSRAWQVAREKSSCFKAIGFGFSQTFRTFLSSYPMMILILLGQILFGWLVLSILPGMKPDSGGSIFLYFLLSQLLFFIKILLKVWRFGSVTALMEENLKKVVSPGQPESVLLHSQDQV